MRGERKSNPKPTVKKKGGMEVLVVGFVLKS